MSHSTKKRGEGFLTFIFFFLSLLLIVLAAYTFSIDPLFRSVFKLGWQAELLQTHYYDQISPEEIFNRTWKGMQQAIPFPVELSGVVNSRSLQQPFTDYGLRTIIKNDNQLVYSIAKGSPFSNHLQVDDKLLSVNDQDIYFRFHLNKVLNDLKGENAQILFERNGEVDSVELLLTEKKRNGLRIIERSDNRIYLSIDSFNDRLFEKIALSFDTLFSEECHTIVIDLRDSQGKFENEREDCVQFFKTISEDIQILLLINEQTTEQAEIFAEQMKKRKNIYLIGEETMGFTINRETIDLFGDVSLSISKINHDKLDLENMDIDSFINADSLSDQIPQNVLTGLKPDIEISEDAYNYSPIVSNLLSQGIFFDFVQKQYFTSLPAIEDEQELFKSYLNYLEQIGFHYDPLRDAVVNLSDENGSDKIATIIGKMKIAENTKANIHDYYDQNDIIPILLRTIQDMQLTEYPSLDDLHRMDDPYIKALFLHLNPNPS